VVVHRVSRWQQGLCPQRTGLHSGAITGLTTKDTTPEKVSPCVLAQLDARRDIQDIVWLGAGFLFGVFGVGAAYLINPTPPPDKIIGKPPNFVAQYMTCYQKYARQEQVSNAVAGCLLGDMLVLIVYASGGL